MKKTMKKCLTLLLALAMLLAMAVPAAAATPYDKTITFTGVAKGDTVKAYQLMKYDANYNEYIFTGNLRPLQPISMILKHNRWRSTLPKVRKSI